MRPLLTIGLAGVVTVAAALVAQQLIPPASANQPLTLYVDRRIGADDNDGRTPDDALRTLDAAVKHAKPGADILIMGYADALRYPGTKDRCITVRGTKDQPITIRRNIYTNSTAPVFLSTDTIFKGGWKPDLPPGAKKVEGAPKTWSRKWPNNIRLEGDPDFGFVKIGENGLTGYAKRPRSKADHVAWFEDDKVWLRMGKTNPNHYHSVVKNGDGLCLSGLSRHVRIKDLSAKGAVHAIRVEPGARDIGVRHVYRYNVLDDDLIPRSARRGADPERGSADPEEGSGGPDEEKGGPDQEQGGPNQEKGGADRDGGDGPETPR